MNEDLRCKVCGKPVRMGAPGSFVGAMLVLCPTCRAEPPEPPEKAEELFGLGLLEVESP